ncbi:rho GTPase-activating protein gacW-like [Schistocerca gregaria]|uniref:rho GTPase-activating protein gacW-like n=1 Tax=Schistocerca gregaria TaxID=7010 RepID=UPI00211DB98F|nr:rho GTPase-activating protein gacW-like [Schistocerca gregaria]
MTSSVDYDNIELVNLHYEVVRLKSSSTFEAKKKFVFVHAYLGSGRFWYFNNEEDSLPQELVNLGGGWTLTYKKKKKKDLDIPPCQVTLKKDKNTFVFGFLKVEEAEGWMERVADVLAEASPKLIDHSVLDSSMKTNQWVPRFVYYIVKLLEPKAETEGMFRLPGSQSLLGNIRNEYLRGDEPLLEGQDVPTLASLLKGYLRELKHPIIPTCMVHKFFATNTIDDVGEAAAVLKELVQEIGPANRITLGFLMRFFLKISKKSSSNKMDVSNLSVAIAPSLFRTPPGMDEMVCATSSNRTMERLVTECENIFPSKDMEMELKSPLGTFHPRVLPRPEMTTSEKQLIDSYMQVRREDVGSCYFCRLLKTVNKSKVEVILCVGSNRIYLFSKGGKLDTDIHYYNLESVTSLNSTSLVFIYSSAITRTHSEVQLSPLTSASWDIDMAIYHIQRKIDYNFIGAPDNFIPFRMDPERLRLIKSFIEDTGTTEDCCGLLRAYRVATDYLDAPISEDLIWSIRNIFHYGFIRELVFSECIRKDRLPNEDFKALTLAMSYNIWFSGIQCDNLRLGNDGLIILSNIFKTNKNLRQLKISNIGASSAGFIALAEAFLLNDVLNLNYLDISNNSIDDKAAEKLASAIGQFHCLIYLDLSSCNLSKRGSAVLLEALHQNERICLTLQNLYLANNVLDSPDASKQLSALLSSATQLVLLNASGTNLVLSNALPASENSTLQTLNVSQCKAHQKAQQDFLNFLNSFSCLTSLFLSDLNNIIHYLIKNYPLQHCANIKKLDISDNDLSDEEVIDILETLLKWPKLEDLRLNRVFTKKSRDRLGLVSAISSFVEKKAIKALQIAGNAKSALKGDLLPFVCSLSNNRTLNYLDISKNQCGDELAGTLGKLLQINYGLQYIRFDDNGLSINGLRSIVSGLGRNKRRCKCYLPMTDIISIIKAESDLSTLVSIVSDFQEMVFDESRRSSDAIISQRSEASIRISGSRRTEQRRINRAEKTTERQQSSASDSASYSDQQATNDDNNELSTSIDTGGDESGLDDSSASASFQADESSESRENNVPSTTT